MVRTQIYLTEREHASIQKLARESGKGQSQLIRLAIDTFLVKRNISTQLQRFHAACGMWKDRKNLPDFRELRKSFDRF